MVYIVTEGIYEDEIIIYVCCDKKDAIRLAKSRDEKYWRVYGLRLETLYDWNTQSGTATENVIEQSEAWEE